MVERTEDERTGTVPAQDEPERSGAEGDVVSDPALDDRVGADWADEGGATPVGPATSTSSADGGDAEPGRKSKHKGKHRAE